MPLQPLQNLLRPYIPDKNLIIFAAGHHKRLVIVPAKRTHYTEFLIAVTLIRLYATAFHVVPQADARVQGPRQDIFAVGREADGDDGGIVFVNESAETLACRCIPDSTVCHKKKEKKLADMRCLEYVTDGGFLFLSHES